jgi:hypothetical protein
MKEYKIDTDRISEYTKRNDNRVFKILIFIILGMAFLIYSPTQQEGTFNEMVWFMTSTILIVGLIYMNNKKLTRLSAENLRIKIGNDSITRIIDLDNEPQMNFLHKNAYQHAKNTLGGFYSKIDFNDFKSIELKKGNLWIKSSKSNSFNGKNIVLIPKELNGFKEVETIVRE